MLDKDKQWHPLVDKQGSLVSLRVKTPLKDCILSKKSKVFDLVGQRKHITGQLHLDLRLDLDNDNNTQNPEQIATEHYSYRTIASNIEPLSEGESVHFYT